MNPTLTYNQQLEWAKTLYTDQGLPIGEIALKTDVDETAIREWITRYNWDSLKHSKLTCKDEQLKNLYDILAAHMARVKTQEEGNTKDADLLIKYTAAIKNLESDTSVSTIIDVARLFLEWLKPIDLELTKAVAHRLDQFVDHRAASR